MLTEKQRIVAQLAATIASGSMASSVYAPSLRLEMPALEIIVSQSIDVAIMICEEVCERDATKPPAEKPEPTRTPGAGVERKG